MQIPTKKEIQVELIFEKLSGKNISRQIFEGIAGWLVSGDSRKEKYRQAIKMANRYFSCELKPSKEAYRSYLSFTRKHGLVPYRSKPVFLNRRAIRWGASAAVALLFLLLTVWFTGRNGVTEALTIGAEQVLVSWTQSGKDDVFLPDGSRVRVGQGTELFYSEDFTENRIIKLNGEAYFSVVEDVGRPFTVEAGGLQVTVLGTEFNVKAYSGESQAVVSLLSGSVEVKDENESFILSPMEELRCDLAFGTKVVERIEDVVAERWKTGLMEVMDKSLGDALRDVSLFYGKRLDLCDNLLCDKLVTTTLDEGESLESILYVIQHMTEYVFDFEIDDDTIRITANE